MHVGYWEVSPEIETRHLEGPKNPGGLRLNLGIYVFVCVYKVHMYMHMLGGRITSGIIPFFLSS